MRIFNKFVAIFVINAKFLMVYKSAIWANIFVNILQVIILYFIWTAVYQGQDSINEVTHLQVITYMIISRIIYVNGVVSWGVNQWISDVIRDGQISIEMLRPIHFQLWAYLRRLSLLILSMLLYGAPVLLILSPFIQFEFALGFGLFAFAISFIMAMSINYFIEFIIGMLGFYTTNGWGLQALKEGIFLFFSGVLIPMSFMPEFFGRIVSFLPFMHIVYAPASILAGTNIEYARTFSLQLFWIIALFLLSKIFYMFSIKNITVQGG